MEQIDDTESIHAEVTKNWMDIESNFDKQTPHETAEIIAKNKYLLEIAGSRFMWYWNFNKTFDLSNDLFFYIELSLKWLNFENNAINECLPIWSFHFFIWFQSKN